MSFRGVFAHGIIGWIAATRAILEASARSRKNSSCGFGLKLLWLSCLGFLSALCTASAAELDVHQIEARHLVNFLKYIQWPEPAASRTGAFTIVVHDSAEMKDTLDEVLRGKDFRGQPIRTVRTMTTHEFANARLVFIHETIRDELDLLLTNAPKSTLTIGEGPMFLAHGGMIEFNNFEGKVRFNLNLPALRKAGFKVDPKLLVAAQDVRR